MRALDPATIHALDQRISMIVEVNPGQLSREEYRYVARLLAVRGGSNLLVFGVGEDSGLWLLANAGGRTTFLESSVFWTEMVRWRHPGVDVRMVRYGTSRNRWREVLEGDAAHLLLELPADVVAVRWDVIFVDAPAGEAALSPGRMKSIYTAAMLARGRPGANLIVHDCDREVERACCDRFLGDELLVHELERTRHYQVPPVPGVDSDRDVEPATVAGSSAGAEAPIILDPARRHEGVCRAQPQRR